jgi:hypothetical protein
MRRGKVEKLSKTLEKLLADQGWSARLREYRVFSLWEKAVGPGIARHAQPSSIRGRRLTVTVDSSAWMQQLSLLKPEIIAKVNDRLGTDGIENITLRLGELEQAAPPEAYEAPTGTLDAAEQKRVAVYLGGISDPEAREALRHVMEKDLLHKKRTQKK